MTEVIWHDPRGENLAVLSEHPQRVHDAALDELARGVTRLQTQIERRKVAPRAIEAELQHMVEQCGLLIGCSD